MKETDLKYPGPLSDSQRLRRLTALNISRAERVALVSPDSDTPTTLKQFLEDAAAKCPGESGIVPDPQPADEATVTDGDTFTDGDFTVAIAVEDNEATAKVSIPATTALVPTGTAFKDGDYTATMTVAANTATTKVTIPATRALIATGAKFTDGDYEVTMTVAANKATAKVTAPALPATSVVVTNGTTWEDANGDTYTITVAGGAITKIVVTPAG